jgi:hypothetical protein
MREGAQRPKSTMHEGAQRPKSGHVYTRLAWWTAVLLVLDVIELIYMLPHLLHACKWPWEDVYGAYDHLLTALISSEAALQLASATVVAIWFVQHFSAQGNEYALRVWALFGLSSHHVPVLVYIFQSVAVALDFWILAYHQTIVVVIGLLRLIASLLVLFNTILSPSWLCCPGHQPSGMCRREPLTEHNFLHQSRSVALVLGVVTALFLLLYGMQYAETFATTRKYFTLDQLRLMNDDEHFFNQELVFHQLSENSSQMLKMGQLPIHRVVLIVLDGMRDDQVEHNPAFASLLSRYQLERLHAIAELPTMSVPNWVTLLSGASPEHTGFRGNLFSGETPFDTILARSRNLDSLEKEFMTALVGCHWWSSLQLSHFPRLKGDGTSAAYTMYDLRRKNLPLPFDFDWADETLFNTQFDKQGEEDTVSEYSDDATDQYRLHVAVEALHDKHDPFRFLLVHLSNIDTQAHAHGGGSESYQRAITQTAGYVDRLLEQIQNTSVSLLPTTVIITSDHGEANVGGHGGAAAELRQVPLLISTFKKREPARSGGAAVSTQYSLKDVATSVSVLLGLPVPRQSQGRLIQSIEAQLDEFDLRMHLQDILEARREMLNVYLIEARYTAHDWCSLAVEWPELIRSYLPENATIEQLHTSIDRLDTLFAETRSSLQAAIISRNVMLTLILLFFLLYAVVTFVIRRAPLWTLGLIGSPVQSAQQAHIGHVNRITLGFAVLQTLVYLGATLGTVVGLYSSWGYTWDSTIIHSVPASLQFLWIALLPGSVMILIINRVYHGLFIAWQPAQPYACLACLSNWWRCCCMETAYRDGHTTDLLPVYLMRLYMLFLSLLVWSMLFVLQGVYSFLLPFVYGNWILDEFGWTMRFRVTSTQLMCVPLLLGNLLNVCLYTRASQRSMNFQLPDPSQPQKAMPHVQSPTAGSATRTVHFIDQMMGGGGGSAGADGYDPIAAATGTDLYSFLVGV